MISTPASTWATIDRTLMDRATRRLPRGHSGRPRPRSYPRPKDPARRLSCELPQGRKAARVNGLCRVRGVPHVGDRYDPPLQRSTAKGPMVAFDSLSPEDLAALH